MLYAWCSRKFIAFSIKTKCGYTDAIDLNPAKLVALPFLFVGDYFDLIQSAKL